MTTAIATHGLNEAQQVILNQTTPKDAIKYRQGRGNQRLPYVTHSWVNGLLNKAFGHRWDWQVLDTLIVPDTTSPSEVIVKGRLTVYLPDGATITKEQFGATDVKRTKAGAIISLGDDLKAASSDAMKKAASLLGVALDLYGERYDDDLGLEPATAANGAADADAEFDSLPSHDLSAHQPNGEAPKPETFSSPDDAKAWAMAQGVFQHQRHCDNAYDKLRRQVISQANGHYPTADEFYSLWVAEVERRKASEQAQF